MKIPHNKKHLNINLIAGLFWLSYFILGLFIKEGIDWFYYGWLLISLTYFANYFYKKKYKYVTIENGEIKVNGPLGKKLNLTDIKRIKKFAGDYIIKTDKKELTINTQVIKPNLLAELNKIVEKLNIQWH